MKYSLRAALMHFLTLISIAFLMFLCVTIKEAQAFSLVEIPAMTTKMIIQSFGLSAEAKLSYVGARRVGDNWFLFLGGTYAGLPVQLLGDPVRRINAQLSSARWN
jgi:hypothetical protein